MGTKKKRPLIPAEIVNAMSRAIAIQAVPLIRARLLATGKRKLTPKEFHDILRPLAKEYKDKHGVRINFKVIFRQADALLGFPCKRD